MFQWLGRVTVRFRWMVLAAAAVVVLIGVTWGTGVFGALSGGGYTDPGSESARAVSRINHEVGRQGVDLLALYSSKQSTVDSPEFRQAISGVEQQLRNRSEVEQVTSYYDLSAQPTTAASATSFVAKDRHATYLAIRLKGSDDAKEKAFTAIHDSLRSPTLTEHVGGLVAVNHDANTQVSKDIARAEMLSMPVVLILLLIIFGSAVAAAMPLLIGGIAIISAFLITRVLTLFTDVSTFAINVITIMGLGLAIDYSLFIIGRFREELANGHAVDTAIRRTMMTAGRTVVVSGVTVALSMAGLLVFPIGFLRSMGYGGIAAVLIAVLGAVTVLPAMLSLLGHRINKLKVRLPWRKRGSGSSVGVPAPRRPAHVEVWARIARSVMRRPVLYLLGTLVILTVLAVPFTHIKLTNMDVTSLPKGADSRVANDRLNHDFPRTANGGTEEITVLVSHASPAEAGQFSQRIKKLDHVDDVAVTASKGTSSVISVRYQGAATSDKALGVVHDIRALHGPAGATVMVAGTSAQMVDLVHSLLTHLPWMIAVIVMVTLVLLFLAFGSVVLPLKAVFMNALSISASLGAIVWVFQDGHGTGITWLDHTGAIQATVPVLMLAILFGLSMDYEVFLLSRIREQWDRTGDNARAVEIGLQRTGRIITSAALLLVIVIGGFAAGGINTIQMIGVGMIVAIVVDATIVRMLLVPATMRLLGHLNWWAPAPMRRFYARYGVHESTELLHESAQGDKGAETSATQLTHTGA